jgi:protein subunit release factor A
MELNIEIRAAEGGEDARRLVAEQASIYGAYAARQGLRFDVVDVGHG